MVEPGGLCGLGGRSGSPPRWRRRFGLKAYGVHVNCYVETPGGGLELWVARRSKTKSSWPGMLDHMVRRRRARPKTLKPQNPKPAPAARAPPPAGRPAGQVAGGLPHGISPLDNVIKECQEEASVPASLAAAALATGAVSYECAIPEGLKRDVLLCFDLAVPADFVPVPADGEVEEFFRWPVAKVAQVVRDTFEYKPNCNLVITDFLVRRGLIAPGRGYLALLAGLRAAEIS